MTANLVGSCLAIATDCEMIMELQTIYKGRFSLYIDRYVYIAQSITITNMFLATKTKWQQCLEPKIDYKRI